MEAPKDYFGREIKVGDYFCHGMRSGNSGCITVGRVTAIVEVSNRWDPEEKTVKIKATKIRSYGPTHKATITEFNQLVVVTEESFPGHVGALLDK